MNQRYIYDKTLLIYANHISQFTEKCPHPEHGIIIEAKLVELDKEKPVIHRIKYHDWILTEMYSVFEEWCFDSFGNPKCVTMPQNESSIFHWVSYFNLSLDEVKHVIDISGGQQPKKFGGIYLNSESHGNDFAKNMIDLVKSRLQ